MRTHGPQGADLGAACRLDAGARARCDRDRDPLQRAAHGDDSHRAAGALGSSGRSRPLGADPRLSPRQPEGLEGHHHQCAHRERGDRAQLPRGLSRRTLPRAGLGLLRVAGARRGEISPLHPPLGQCTGPPHGGARKPRAPARVRGSDLRRPDRARARCAGAGARPDAGDDGPRGGRRLARRLPGRGAAAPADGGSGWHEVARTVNSIRNEGPDLIEPIEPVAPDLFSL